MSAILLPERDTDGLTDALLYLIDHPERWEKMGSAGRAYVEQFHDIEKEAPELERKYSTLIQK